MFLRRPFASSPARQNWSEACKGRALRSTLRVPVCLVPLSSFVSLLYRFANVSSPETHTVTTTRLFVSFHLRSVLSFYVCPCFIQRHTNGKPATRSAHAKRDAHARGLCMQAARPAQVTSNNHAASATRCDGCDVVLKARAGMSRTMTVRDKASRCRLMVCGRC